MKALKDVDKRHICVHEGSTVASLINQVNSKSSDDSYNSVALHVPFLFFEAISLEENSQLFSTLNYFFFSFFVLRGVHDHLSGSFFQTRGKKGRFALSFTTLSHTKNGYFCVSPSSHAAASALNRRMRF